MNTYDPHFMPRAPVFIVGVQRSGTTLLRLILDSHSRMAIPFESFVLVEYFQRLSQYNYLADREDFRKLAKDLLASKGICKWSPKVVLEDLDFEECTDCGSLVDEIFSAFARKSGKPYWGDKTPSYLEDMHIINKIFPQAKFIHIIRDGRDVALSLISQKWGPPGFIPALKQWKEKVYWGRKMGSLLSGPRYFELRYEDLLESPKQWVGAILEFLDLSYEEGMLEKFYQKAGNKVPETSREYHPHVGSPINKELGFKWKSKLSNLDKVLADKLAADLLETLGYPLSEQKAPEFLTKSNEMLHNLRDGIKWRLSAHI